jgi:hypothetical protein
MAKPKVNPKKEATKEGERELSIPEAELMAAYIGTLIAETIIDALEPLRYFVLRFFYGAIVRSLITGSPNLRAIHVHSSPIE